MSRIDGELAFSKVNTIQLVHVSGSKAEAEREAMVLALRENVDVILVGKKGVGSKEISIKKLKEAIVDFG